MTEPKRTYRLQDSMPTFDQHAADGEIQTRRKSILVVEDEEDLNHALACQLRQAGYFVVSSFDAMSGLQQTGFHRPDLVLIDLLRPSLKDSGFVGEFLELDRMREVPVIVITDSECESIREEADELGVNELLQKPVTHAHVVEQVGKLLDGGNA